ncbi:MAG: sugar phosphate nucleotidyltransferase [Verrucomicrobiales bacterium]
MPTAFVLGAGLGTRLRPLTDRLPKPLIAIAHEPILVRAFRHLALDLGCDRFVVNTHHRAEEYGKMFPDGNWENRPVIFRHEPILLDTGGGLTNARDLFPPGESIALYNGDILCDAPLAPLAAAHARSNADVTLLLRSSGDLRNVVCAAEGGGDFAEGPILDLRGLRGAGGPSFQFAGIALVGPRFLDFLPPPGGIFSLIPEFARAIDAGLKIRGIVIDQGEWSDLGTPEALLEAHRLFQRTGFPRYAPEEAPLIHPLAEVTADTVDHLSWVGPDCVVPEGCRVEEALLLPGAKLAPGEVLHRVVRGA